MYIEPVFDGRQTAVTTYRVMKVDFCASYEVFRGRLHECYTYMTPVCYPLYTKTIYL